MTIDQIRRLSLEYAKGHVKTGEFWRTEKSPQTYAEWFAASLKDPVKAGKFKPKIPWREGDPCNNCKTPIVRKVHSKPPKEKLGGYWFEWWFVCPKCNRMFMVESAKRYFGVAPRVAGKAENDFSDYKYGPPRAIDEPTNAYLHQDPGDDGKVPW